MAQKCSINHSYALYNKGTQKKYKKNKDSKIQISNRWKEKCVGNGNQIIWERRGEVTEV